MERKMENHSGRKNPLTSERELAHAALARKLAAEGMVLLKNEDVLPLSLSVPTALFGSGAGRTVKGGTGSGDVNSRENISVYQGLQEAGMRIVNEEWLRDYNRRYEAARERWKEKILILFCVVGVLLDPLELELLIDGCELLCRRWELNSGPL